MRKTWWVCGNHMSYSLTWLTHWKAAHEKGETERYQVKYKLTNSNRDTDRVDVIGQCKAFAWQLGYGAPWVNPVSFRGSPRSHSTAPIQKSPNPFDHSQFTRTFVQRVGNYHISCGLGCLTDLGTHTDLCMSNCQGFEPFPFMLIPLYGKGTIQSGGNCFKRSSVQPKEGYNFKPYSYRFLHQNDSDRNFHIKP